MQSARPHHTRRRHRARRVVTPALAERATAIDEGQRTALRVGLTFAAHLRRLFPDWYAAYVGDLHTTDDILLGVMGAFLSLAHTQLIALDIDANLSTPGGYNGWYVARLPFAPKEPRNALHPLVGDATARALLINDGSAWLRQPVPRVYGISVDDVSRGDSGYGIGRSIGKHVLTLLIWRMLAGTTWEPLAERAVVDLATTRTIDLDLGRAIAALPQLPAATPLAPLCAQLDRVRPAKIGQLGTLIAYACGRLDNGFTSVTTAEARQRYDQVIDLDWERPAAAFAAARAAQQQAAAITRAYSRLCGRMQREDGLWAVLRGAILEAAGAVAGAERTFTTYDPAALYWRLP
ncbi:MAG: hypothetical protein IPO81_09400 [Kouleothrix sp.]|nr:hypothetical protein [Kouleothrix sp.]